MWRRAGAHGLMKNNEIILSIHVVSLEGLNSSTNRNLWEMYSETPSVISVAGISRTQAY